MNEYLEQVKSAINETVFHSSSSYSWHGNESTRLSPRIRRAMTMRTERNYLLYQLQSQLYADFYIRGGASQGASTDSGGSTDAVSFVQALSDANCGTGSWENGWKVLTHSPDEVVVGRGKLMLWVRPDDFAVEDGKAIETGTNLKLRLPKELRSISPGYYMALGDRSDDAYEVDNLLRIYWNLRAVGAPIFIRTATLLLNGEGKFFKLKVLSDPASYARCDAAVIYIHRGAFQGVSQILSRIHARVASHLMENVPAFTKRVAPGVGVAEDPGPGESFGQHRCRLLADGMIRAYEEGARDIDERLAIVTDTFTSMGISVHHPYLNRDSTDIYSLPGG